ncbi:MAG: OmpA family protein [Pseudomonadota bacterium]
MGRLKFVWVVAAIGLLSGCVGKDIEHMRSAEGTGTAFTKALTEEYREITTFEADEMYDWEHAGYFAKKGLRAAGGEVVEPEVVSDWPLPEARVGEMTDARARLVTLLDASARTKVPATAARAQGRFDCWIEQQEENWQLDHIAACRDQFYAALSMLEAEMAPKVEAPAPPEPVPAATPESFLIFFAFDKADLTPAALQVIADSVAVALETGFQEFAVTGYTDTVGTPEYNLKLSLRRAQSVKDALVAAGVPEGNVTVAGRGENDLAVPTADQVREQANRRAVILLQ